MNSWQRSRHRSDCHNADQQTANVKAATLPSSVDKHSGALPDEADAEAEAEGTTALIAMLAETDDVLAAELVGVKDFAFSELSWACTVALNDPVMCVNVKRAEKMSFWSASALNRKK